MVELTARRVRTHAVPIVLRRALADTRIPLSLAGAGAVGGLGFANGGYFPVAWGWSGVALLAVAAVALVAGISVQASWATWTFLGGLAALTGWVALSLLWTSSVTETVFEV